MTVDEIKAQHFERLKGEHVWLVVENGNGWEVHEWLPDGVCPPASYDTKRKAASRLLQLLRTGPVAPQTWPEKVCIGFVSVSEAES
jgi:hypothetical protein